MVMSAAAEEASYESAIPEIPALQIAEQIGVDALRAIYTQRKFWWDNLEGGTTLQRGWRALEEAFAGSDQVLRKESFDTAYSSFKEASDFASEPNHPFWLSARAAVAYRPAFTERLVNQPIDENARTATYRNIGAVTAELQTSKATTRSDIYVGARAELITLALLLRAPGKYFPFFASPREESSQPRSHNHDLYLLSPGFEGPKIPAQIKHGRTASNGIARDSVESISVQSHVKRIFAFLKDRTQDDPIFEEVASSGGESAIEWLTTLLIRESNFDELTSLEREMLDTGTELFLDTLTSRTANNKDQSIIAA